MRTTNRIRTAAIAATALVAALSLTACGGEDKAAGTESAKPAATSADGKARPDAQKTETPEADTISVPADGKHAGGNGNGGNHSKKPEAASNTKAPSSARTACTAANTQVTVARVSRPINHLLLTLKNTGSGVCDAYYAPRLGFDGAQSVFRILEDSKPQAVVTLAPGEEAYAGIGLTGEPGQGKLYKSENLSVSFAERNGSTDDTPATLKLPAETYWDDNGFVTYWQSDRADALTY